MNKIKFAAVLVVAALFTTVSAEAKSFRWGVRAGLNVEKMHFNEKTFDSDNRCGFNIGVTGDYLAPFGLGADISLLYTNLSATSIIYDTDLSTGEVVKTDVTKKGNFFSIPLHVKYRISLPVVNKVVMPYVFTGPNAAFKLGGNKENFKSADVQWGWDLGLGLEFISHLQISANYTFGINNVARYVFRNVDKFNVASDIKVRNNYWTISAAWLF